MRLLLRLHDDRGRATVPHPSSASTSPDAAAPADVEVRAADDLTVGELAQALAEHLGTPLQEPDGPPLTLTTRGGPLPAGAAVAVAGPASGSDVTLVAAGPSDTGAPVPSGAVLVHEDGTRTPLAGGTTEVDDAEVLVDGRVSVHLRRPGPLAVNGGPVLGAQVLAHGDLLRTACGLHTLVVESSLAEPEHHGAFCPHRGAAPWTRAGDLPEQPPVVLPDPPAAGRRPRLPLLSASVPLLMGLGLWLVTRSVASVVGSAVNATPERSEAIICWTTTAIAGSAVNPRLAR